MKLVVITGKLSDLLGDSFTHEIGCDDITQQDNISDFLNQQDINHRICPDTIQLSINGPEDIYKIQRFIEKTSPLDNGREGSNINFQRDLRPSLSTDDRPMVGQTIIYDDKPYVVESYGPRGTIKILNESSFQYIVDYKDLVEYAAATVRGGFQIPLSSEEKRILDNIEDGSFYTKKMSHRETELCRKMHSRGLIRKDPRDDKKFVCNYLDDVWHNG